MDLKRTHLYEKTQVVLVAAGLLAAMFWGLSAWFSPADPLGPVLLMPEGRLTALAGLIGMVAVFAAVAGLLTPGSRVEGTLAAAMVGLGGLALRSATLQPFLWYHPMSPAGLCGLMLLEVLLLGLGAGVAMLLGLWVRAKVVDLLPRLGWRDVEATIDPAQLDEAGFAPRRAFWKAAERPGLLEKLGLEGQWFCQMLRGVRGGALSDPAGRRAYRLALQQGLGHLAIGLGVTVVLAGVLLQSTLRNQVLFALLGSTFVGVMAANHFLPLRSILTAWALPLLAAVLWYGLGMVTGSLAQPVSRALPIDWIAAGTAGALLGSFTTGRLRETRLAEAMGGG